MIIVIQVWNNDVKFFCVKDSSGSPVAYFYFDPYSRPSEKRQGAWMDEVVARSHVLSPDGNSSRLPVAHMVCNQTPPVGSKPSLMTFREVTHILLYLFIYFNFLSYNYFSVRKKVVWAILMGTLVASSIIWPSHDYIY